MKKFSKNERDFLIHCLQKNFSNNVQILGYSLIVEIENIHFSKEVLFTIEQFGVKVYHVEDYNNRIILGYGH